MSFPLTGQTAGIRTFFADIQYIYQRHPGATAPGGPTLRRIWRSPWSRVWKDPGKMDEDT